jgi:hypothetical protein
MAITAVEPSRKVCLVRKAVLARRMGQWDDILDIGVARRAFTVLYGILVTGAAYVMIGNIAVGCLLALGDGGMAIEALYPRLRMERMGEDQVALRDTGAAVERGGIPDEKGDGQQSSAGKYLHFPILNR